MVARLLKLDYIEYFLMEKNYTPEEVRECMLRAHNAGLMGSEILIETEEEL